MTTATHERININELSKSEKIALIKSTYAKKSYFQDKFGQDTIELSQLDITERFRNEIMRILIDKKILEMPVELEKLHNYISDDMRAYNFDDGVNKISTFFYETNPQFMSVYYSFIKHLRENFVKEPFLFQATPTIRLQCPNAKNNNHYPRYHTDVGYGHPPEEINIWFPLTHMLTGHGFHIMTFAESKQILENFNYDFAEFIHSAIHDKNFSHYCDAASKPVETQLGNILAFDSRCIHSGMPMQDHTRISMDIRILPVTQYEKMKVTYQGAGRRKILFAPGHSYNQHDSDYFLNYEGR